MAFRPLDPFLAELELVQSSCVLADGSVALALVCDEHMCPAIEAICERLAIPDDIAGASLLALGSSAPEIIMNASGTAQVMSMSVSARPARAAGRAGAEVALEERTRMTINRTVLPVPESGEPPRRGRPAASARATREPAPGYSQVVHYSGTLK